MLMLRSTPRFIDDLGRYFPVEPRYDYWLFDKGKLELAPKESYRNRIGLSDGSSYLDDVDTVVIKMGSNILVHKSHDSGTYARRCAAVDLTSLVKDKGKRVLVVSSGNMALGRKRRARAGIRIPEAERYSFDQLYQDALWGKDLFELWQENFIPPPLRQRIRYSLVTNDDFAIDSRRKKIFRDYNSRMDAGIIQIVNEDDAAVLEKAERTGSRATGPIFGCNDGLASYIAKQLSDDYNVFMIVMNNEWGIRPRAYFDDSEAYEAQHAMPVEEEKMRLPVEREAIAVVNDMQNLESEIASITSRNGRGGMLAKFNAIKDAFIHGIPIAVVNGMYPNFDSKYRKGLETHTERSYRPLHGALDGEFIGTRFVPGSLLQQE